MNKILIAFFVCLAFGVYAKDSELRLSSVIAEKIGGHEYVDLGLPSGTLWATCNVGSNNPYISGDYFAWGEVEPRDSFLYDNYKFFEREEIIENGISLYRLTDIGGNISGTEFDAAHVLWGEGWRMPTAEEFDELLSYCQTEFLTEKFTKGLRVYGPNGNSLFLPVGTCSNGLASQAILTGNYWSGNLSESDSDENRISAVALYFCNSTLQSNAQLRYCGQSIRPVVDGKYVESSVETFKEDIVEISYADGGIVVRGLHDSCEVAVSDISARIIAKRLVEGSHCEFQDLQSGVYVVSIVNNGIVINTQKIAIR